MNFPKIWPNSLTSWPIYLLLLNYWAIELCGNVIANSADQIDLHIVVITQNHSFEFDHAQKLRDELLRNGNSSGIDGKLSFHVTLLQQKFVSPKAISIEGYWAVWPAIQRFTTKQKEAKWTLFCSPFIQISNVHMLIDHFLTKYNHHESKFIGNALVDESPTVIHHYHGGFIEDGRRFGYPDMSTGFAISENVLQKILSYFQKDVRERKFRPNFIIDPGFEFAQLVFESAGILMENDSEFFAGQNNVTEKCSLIDFRLPINSKHGNGNKWKDDANIFYAVKTHSANHKTRVPYIKQTWANRVKPHIGYFSEEEDAQIPTINLHIPNTKRGHCGKTFAIFRYFIANSATKNGAIWNYDWLMLADDDTLLSVNRLEKFIQSLPNDVPVIAGQRYGYGFSADGANGYDYPTGGSGILFSRNAVEMIANGCDCPALDSPDDMIIGICARRLGISIIHSAAFHQARPIDYPKGHLQTWIGHHISFHKFEGLDPMEIYKDFLADDSRCEGECEEFITRRMEEF